MGIYIIIGGSRSCKGECHLRCLGLEHRFNNSKWAVGRDHGSLIARSGQLSILPEGSYLLILPL